MSEAPVKLKSTLLSAEIAPLGAELVALRDAKGGDLLFNGDPAYWTGRAPLLFPIVGRLPGDVLLHQGVSYPMLQHGFARRRVFTLVSATEDTAVFALEADEETRKQYPFEFSLRVTYTLLEATLAITATVGNPGPTPLPASFGFHPAFAFPLPYGGTKADHRLIFDKQEVETIHRPVGGLFSTATEANPAVDGIIELDDDTLFARDALIFQHVRSHHIRYGVPGEPGLEVDFEGMPQLGLWGKPGAPFVCIEPWYGHASPEGEGGEFTDKPGLAFIPPGGAKSFAMSVRWLPDIGR